MTKAELLRYLTAAVVSTVERDVSAPGTELRTEHVARIAALLHAREAVERWMPDGGVLA